MASKGKQTLVSWRRRFQPFNLEREVCDGETLETDLNSASKNTSATDIIPHGTKSLLTSVIETTYMYGSIYPLPSG